MDAGTPLAAFHLFDQRGESVAQTGFGRRLELAPVPEQRDPGITVAARLDQTAADTLEQLGTVLFPNDELVDIADCPQYVVEVLYRLFSPFALCDFAHQIAVGLLAFGHRALQTGVAFLQLGCHLIERVG